LQCAHTVLNKGLVVVCAGGISIGAIWAAGPVVQGVFSHVMAAGPVVQGVFSQVMELRSQSHSAINGLFGSEMTCPNTCRKLIATALCHSKCVSVNLLAENIKGMRSCTGDTGIVESSLDDKEQWEGLKKKCFTALDLGTLICPRDMNDGGTYQLNKARDLFECLRPSAFATFTEQCIGSLQAMKC
jgi:hypothetical protein